MRFFALPFALRCLAAVTCFSGMGCATGQVYVSDAGLSDEIGAYTMVETQAINPGLIQSSQVHGFGTPQGIVIDHQVLYAAGWGGQVLTTTETGADRTVLITGLSGASEIAVANGILFVASSGPASRTIIGAYNASTGAPVNPTLVTVTYPVTGLAVSGNTLYVARSLGNQISTYDATTGAPLQTNFISVVYPKSISLSGNVLYVLQATSAGTVATYDATTGSLLNASLLAHPNADSVFVAGNHLFLGVIDVSTGGQSYVSEFDAATGALLQAAFITGLNSPDHLFVRGPIPTGTPGPITAAAGGIATISLPFNDRYSPSYQWYFDGQPLSDGPNVSGSQSYTLTLTHLEAAQSGSYTLAATDPFATVISDPTVVTVTGSSTPASGGRLLNLSVRGSAASGVNALIAGFAIGGEAAATKQLLIRGVGPDLAAFGISDALPDPTLQVYQTGSLTPQIVGTNSGWSSPEPAAVQAVAAAESATGAFPLAAGSASCALLQAFSPGTYSANVSALNGDQGIALAELYDADGSATANAAALINISARGPVSSGNGSLIAGFVVGGQGTLTVLVRGIGPTLATFGVANPLATPVLTLNAAVNGAETVIASNSGWGGSAPLAQAFAQVGAFPLAPGSADAALLITLPPGQYFAVLSNPDSQPAVGMVEVYALP